MTESATVDARTHRWERAFAPPQTPRPRASSRVSAAKSNFLSVNQKEIKMTKAKKQHVKVLAEAPISSKKTSKVQDCATVVILPGCKTSKKGVYPCDISCTDSCKPYCQTQSKLNPTPPPSNPCNTSDNQKYPGEPLKSQKKDVSKKPMSKGIGRNARK